MKKRTIKIPVIIAILVLIYLVTACGISYLLCYQSMNSQADRLADVLKQPIEAEDPIKWKDDFLNLDEDMWGHMEVFDGQGRLLFTSDEDNEVSDIEFDCSCYVSDALSGNMVRKIAFKHDGSNGVLRPVYSYGTPVLCDGKVIGAVFNVTSPLFFANTLRSYIIIYSAAFVIAGAAVIIIISIQRKAAEMRQVYISNVTHALKTPVTAIKALSESICDDENPDFDELKIDLQLILQQADLQTEMVNNILSLSRLQTSKAKFKFFKLTGEELINDPIKKHTAACKQKNIELSVTDRFYEIKYYYTDPEAIRQIFDLLLDNSVKFTHEGGRIEVDVKPEGNHATITVRDNGVGMSRETASRAFERFYTTSAGNSDGSGLGLAVVNELIKSLKEKVWIESEPEKGTSVFFTIKISK